MLIEYIPTDIRNCRPENDTSTTNLAMQSPVVSTGSASIFKMPQLLLSVWFSKTVTTTMLAGNMNHAIAINPCIKKLFSGEMPSACMPKFICAFKIDGIQRIMVAASKIKSIFDRRIFPHSTLIRDKKLIKTTYFSKTHAFPLAGDIGYTIF